MIHRRSFMNISLTVIPGIIFSDGRVFDDKRKLKYKLSLETPTKYFNGEQCFVHPRAGIIPGWGAGGRPRVVFLMNTQELSGSDVYKSELGFFTDNLGETWSKPQAIETLQPRYLDLEGAIRPIVGSDYFPAYHKASKTLLTTGHTVVYTPDWKRMSPRPRSTIYSIYDPGENIWTSWKTLEMPDNDKFYFEGAGSVQRFDKEDGTILLPTYFTPRNEVSSRVTVMNCSFFDGVLEFQHHGNEMSIDDMTRGLHEPSLTKFENTYFLTIRNDKCGFVTKSRDGLIYDPIKIWSFDDGEELGNYNTQQHWVTHSDGLFLVYTRKGANNDHVFRHRAPLFIGRVDPKKLCVIRKTEQILIPERGARLGNFGITNVSPDETWVSTAEWMQPIGVDKYGSDGSVWVARIHWNKPNLLF